VTTASSNASFAPQNGTAAGLPIKMLNDRILVSIGDEGERYEVEVGGIDYIILRERDIHAVAAERLEEGSTGLYL